MHTPECDRRRRLVAFAGHAPALWLVYRETLPRALWAPNAIALAVTIGAVALAWRASPLASLTAFVLGHVAWGAILARRLPRSAAARTAGCPSGCGA